MNIISLLKNTKLLGNQISIAEIEEIAPEDVEDPIVKEIL